jgi:hypothetical protein
MANAQSKSSGSSTIAAQRKCGAAEVGRLAAEGQVVGGAVGQGGGELVDRLGVGDLVLGEGRKRDVLFQDGGQARPVAVAMAEDELVVGERQQQLDQGLGQVLGQLARHRRVAAGHAIVLVRQPPDHVPLAGRGDPVAGHHPDTVRRVVVTEVPSCRLERRFAVGGLHGAGADVLVARALLREHLERPPGAVLVGGRVLTPRTRDRRRHRPTRRRPAGRPR